MEQLNIRKYDRFKFSLSYQSIPDFILRLNFEPIVDEFNLTGDFTLLHWQAKPKQLRRWGAFCQLKGTTQYHAFDHFIANGLEHRGFQLDETDTLFVPTAVVYYPNCTCSVDAGKGTIRKIGG